MSSMLLNILLSCCDIKILLSKYNCHRIKNVTPLVTNRGIYNSNRNVILAHDSSGFMSDIHNDLFTLIYL